MVVGTSTEGPEISESQKTPSTPPKPPPNTPEETPRITNLKEGNRKQKEAAKKLSEYSREVAKRKKGQDAEEKTSEASEESLGHTSDDVESIAPPRGGYYGMSTGNIIAALGVGVAAICLYLSYRPQTYQDSSPPNPPPQPPPTRSEPQPPPTRFKRL